MMLCRNWKAVRIDGITYEVLKLYNTNKDWFSKFINVLWGKEYFLYCWKVASVVLIPKIGKDLTKPSNYIPVCLLLN